MDTFSDVRKIPSTEQQQNDQLYLHEIKTKYYTTKIAFHPFENLNDISEEIKQNIEGFLIYFDANDVSIKRLSIL